MLSSSAARANMSLSPVHQGGSPETSMADIRLNLDCEFRSLQDIPSGQKGENMSVFARVRPILREEEEAGYQDCIAAIDEKTVRALIPASSNKYKSSRHSAEVMEDFKYTEAFGPEIGQFVFFEKTIMNVMQNFIEGQNSLVFSYGITGSGKTYTLQGTESNPGLIPLSLHLFFGSVENQILKDIVVKPHLFSDILVLNEQERLKELQLRKQLLSSCDPEDENTSGSSFQSTKSFSQVLCGFFYDNFKIEERETTLPMEDMLAAQAAVQMKEFGKKSAEQCGGLCSVWVSFAEIYNENIYDLLQPYTSQRMKLNMGEDKNGEVYIKGLTEVCVTNCDEALQLLNIGRKNLRIASTKLNYQSSRSHCIFTVKVVRIPSVKSASYGKVNRLFFCDLAGSERCNKAQTSGIRLKEANYINTSLMVLGRCLDQLRLNQSLRDKRIVPFRESKLTRLFSGIFLGKGKTVMIANASPSEHTFDETLHVLKFSAIATKLRINDSYINSASTTLANITDQWVNCKQNASNLSLGNGSISFEDSYDEIIQEKDELIEKLLDFAASLKSNLEQEKNEKLEMEAKIRSDVCREYSEFSDHLIENQKKIHERELDDYKEIYEKRISDMEKMYEDTIQKYKEQLYESDEFSEGDSQEDDESPVRRKRSVKSDLNRTFHKQQKLNQSLLSDSSVTDFQQDIGKASESDKDKIIYSLRKAKNSLEEDFGRISDQLDAVNKENNILKGKLFEAEDQVSNHVKSISLLTVESEKLKQKHLATVEEYEGTIAELKKELSSLTGELHSLKQELQESNVTIQEQCLEISDLKLKCTSQKEDIIKTEQENMSLFEKLESSTEQFGKLDKVKLEEFSNTVNTYKEKVDELKAICNSQESKIIELNEEKIILLEKFESATKKSDELLKIKQEEANISVQEYMQNINVLKTKCSSQEAEIFKLEEERATLLEKLECASNQIDELLKIKQEKADISDQECMQNINVLKTKCSSQETEIFKLEEERTTLLEKLERASNQIDKLFSMEQEANDSIQELMQEIDELKSKCSSQELQIARLEEEQQNILEKLKPASKENGKPSNIRQEVDNIIQEHVEEITTIKSKCKTQESEISKLEEKNVNLLEELKSVSKENDKLISMKEETDNTIKEHLQEIATLKSKCNIQESEIAKLEIEKRNLVENLECATKEKDKLITTKEETDNIIKEHLQEIAILKSKCNIQESGIAELEMEKKNLVENLECATKEKDELIKGKHGEADSSIKEYMQEIAVLNSKCNIKESEISKLEEEKGNLLEKLKYASKELDKIVILKQGTDNAIQEHLQEISILKSKCSSLESKITDLEEEKMALFEKFESATKKAGELAGTEQESNINAEANLQEIELKTKCSIQESKIAELEEVKRNLMEELELVAEKHGEMLTVKQEAGDTVQEITALKSKCSTLELEIATLKEEKMNVLEKLECLSKEHGELNKKHEETNNIIQEHFREINILKDKNSTQELKISELEEERPTLLEKLESASSDLGELNMKKEETSNIIQEHLHEISVLKDKNSSQELKISELEEERLTLLEKLESASRDLGELNMKKEETNNTIQEHLHEINVLKNKNSTQELKFYEVIEERLTLLRELESMSKDLGELNKKHEETKNIIQEHLHKINVLKDKNNTQELKIYELEEERLTLLDKLDSASKDLGHEIMQTLVLVLQNCEMKATNKVKKLYSGFQNYTEELSNLKSQMKDKDIYIKELEKANCLLSELVEILEKCEINAATKITNTIEQNFKLKQQISGKGSSMEDFEKALCDSQTQLKGLQSTFKQQLAAERQQHSVEIEQTMHLKHLCEEENAKLKASINQTKEKRFKSSPEIKENSSKYSPERPVRMRRIRSKVSTIDSSDDDFDSPVERQRNKKLSDCDFVPPKEKRQNKKRNEEYKPPGKRTSKRKLNVENSVENESPVQKIANFVGAKIRTVAENVAQHISSPIMTRGQMNRRQRKLFNHEASASSSHIKQNAKVRKVSTRQSAN